MIWQKRHWLKSSKTIDTAGIEANKPFAGLTPKVTPFARIFAEIYIDFRRVRITGKTGRPIENAVLQGDLNVIKILFVCHGSTHPVLENG